MILIHIYQYSLSSIKKRRNTLGLFGARSKQSAQTPKELEQAVLTQLDRDPAKGKGVAGMKSIIAHDQGIHIKRDFVWNVMKTHDPAGFALREPTAKKILRFPKAPIGIHERWACDGHDKLYKIGFPLYAFVDDASATWLDGFVVPNNRMGAAIGFLFLCLIEKYGGTFIF